MRVFNSDQGGYYLQDEGVPLATTPWIRVSPALGQFIGILDHEDLGYPPVPPLPLCLPDNWLFLGNIPCTPR